LDVVLTVDSQQADQVAIQPAARAEVEVRVNNTLEDTIYDTQIVVTLGGNALSVFNVFPTSGYYDSTAKTITWDVANIPDLESLEPGEYRTYRFGVEPRGDIGRTPQLTVKADVNARRVSEDRATELLTGTADTTIKVATAPSLQGEAGHNNGIFSDTGPVPPRVGVETTYTMSLMLQNGSNDVTEAVVTTTLPQYVEWTDQTAGAGSLSYNPTNREIQWTIGSLEAGAATFSSFQISFEPRVTQAGQRPVLMGEQRARATDQFTGTVVRVTNPPVTTQLSSEAGFTSDSGFVQN